MVSLLRHTHKQHPRPVLLQVPWLLADGNIHDCPSTGFHLFVCTSCTDIDLLLANRMAGWNRNLFAVALDLKLDIPRPLLHDTFLRLAQL